MISPTGQGIRVDRSGRGTYLAPRKDGIHYANDFLCQVGQEVVAMEDETRILRKAWPHPDTRDLCGLLVQGPTARMKMFNFEPLRNIVGRTVREGTVIGIAQDVSVYYDDPEMMPHIHVKVIHCDLISILEW